MVNIHSFILNTFPILFIICYFTYFPIHLGNGAWTAKSSDFSQYLIIDLRHKRNITALSTQGRPFTSEFVQEYRIEYGNKALDYSEYKDREGHPRVGLIFKMICVGYLITIFSLPSGNTYLLWCGCLCFF